MPFELSGCSLRLMRAASVRRKPAEVEFCESMKRRFPIRAREADLLHQPKPVLCIEMPRTANMAKAAGTVVCMSPRLCPERPSTSRPRRAQEDALEFGCNTICFTASCCFNERDIDLELSARPKDLKT